AEDPVAGEALKETVRDHGAGAAQAFFRGLEDEVHRAVEARLGGKQLGGGKEHGGVTVVPAAVKLAGDLRAVFELVELLDGQRVEVGVKADGPRGLAAPQGG